MCIVPIAKVAPLDKDKKLLASNCLTKKSGRAAVVPRRGSQSAAGPCEPASMAGPRRV